MTPAETTEAIQRVARLEERERILGVIEYVRDTLGDSSYEQYTRKKLNEVIRIVTEL